MLKKKKALNRPKIRVWIKRSDLIHKKSRHLLGDLKVWGVNLALGPEWLEFVEVRNKK